jgi:hypothetical protein
LRNSPNPSLALASGIAMKQWISWQCSVWSNLAYIDTDTSSSSIYRQLSNNPPKQEARKALLWMSLTSESHWWYLVYKLQRKKELRIYISCLEFGNFKHRGFKAVSSNTSHGWTLRFLRRWLGYIEETESIKPYLMTPSINVASEVAKIFLSSILIVLGSNTFSLEQCATHCVHN